MTDRAFELAHFWRIDPARILDLTLSEFELYERQAERIAKLRNPD